jgi:two-component system chemotaxis sensor kinase CheA
MRRFRVPTSSDNDLLDLFTFHVAREKWLLPMTPATLPGLPGAPRVTEKDPGYGFFDNAPAHRPRGAPWTRRRRAMPRAAKPAARAPARADRPPAAPMRRVSVEGRPAHQPGRRARHHQAMLAQNSKHIDTALYQQLVPAWPIWNATHGHGKPSDVNPMFSPTRACCAT